MKYIRCEHVNSRNVFYEKTKSYNSFIREMINQIKSGKTAYLYFSYQVDDVKKYFRDQVDIKYNARFNWWEATLKGL